MRNNIFLSIIFSLTILLAACTAPSSELPPAPSDPGASNMGGQAITDLAGAWAGRAGFSIAPTPVTVGRAVDSASYTATVTDTYIWNKAWLVLAEGTSAESVISVDLVGTPVAGSSWIPGSATFARTVTRADRTLLEQGKHYLLITSCRRSSPTVPWDCGTGWQYKEISVTYQTACALTNCLDGATCYPSGAFTTAAGPVQCVNTAGTGTLVNQQTVCITTNPSGCYERTPTAGTTSCWTNNEKRVASSLEYQCRNGVVATSVSLCPTPSCFTVQTTTAPSICDAAGTIGTGARSGYECNAGTWTTSLPPAPGGLTLCGNNVCNTGETFGSCPDDCTTCGNNVCNVGETLANCPADCTSGKAVQ